MNGIMYYGCVVWMCGYGCGCGISTTSVLVHVSR